MKDKLGYVVRNGDFLRCGFTTGTCAAAAAKGATEMLLKQKTQNQVDVVLPDRKSLKLELVDQKIFPDSASCAVIKDAGDDFDITDGTKVIARVFPSQNAGITLKAGEGIGTVIQKGLPVSPGEAAINPVPRKMIFENVSTACSENGYDLSEKGIVVEISIPDGKTLADKTLNPKLGIKNGLSILGTTGVVRPMSHEALINSIALELSVLKNSDLFSDKKTVCFVPGNYGEKFAQKLGITSGIIKVSNFIGELLERAVLEEFENILIIGDLGKLVKISAGIFQTHSKISDARAEILTANIAALGAPTVAVVKMMNINTTAAGVQIIQEYHLEAVFKILADRIKTRMQDYTQNRIQVEVILFTGYDRELARTEEADVFIEELKGKCRA